MAVIYLKDAFGATENYILIMIEVNILETFINKILLYFHYYNILRLNINKMSLVSNTQ